MTAPIQAGDAFSKAATRLAKAGVKTARLEARVLLGCALDMDGALALASPGKHLSAASESRLEIMVSRRERREPLAQILGRKEFWSLPFCVNGATLIPRPDSETVVEAALLFARGGEDITSILDLGTGSGCLLLALLSELPQAYGIGVDISGEALDAAAFNAISLGLSSRAKFIQGDWACCLKARFSLIAANPPYIPDGDIEGLEPEVSLFEPRQALSGGNSGLDCYLAIAPFLSGLLSPGGRVFLEVGKGQAFMVADLLRQHGLTVVDVKKDLSGIERCVVAAL